MKKLLYTLFLFSALFINSCETNSVSKLSRGVKVIRKCCKELAGHSRKSADVLKEENQTRHNVSSVLPAYFWDTKSMIW